MKDGVFTEEEAMNMSRFMLNIYAFICLIPAILVTLSKCFDVLADEDTRRRNLLKSEKAR